MRVKCLLFLILFVALSSTAIAKTPFRLRTDIRYRWEYENNFNQKFYGKDPPKGDADDGFLLQRIRLVFDSYIRKNIHLSIGMQDSRAYDVALPNNAFYNSRLGLEHNPNKDYWEPFDTYLELNRLFGQRLSLKIGRQRIAYGDKRIFGPGEWGNTGRYVWDAAKLSYRFGGDFIDTFYGKNIIHDPRKISLGHRHFFACTAIYSHFLVPIKGEKIYFEPFWIRKYDHHPNFRDEARSLDDFGSNYYGLRDYARFLSGFDYDFTFVWQTGHWGHDNLKAYGYHVLFGYRPKAIPLRTRVSVEFSYASGDNNPKDRKHGTFDGVFGARDKMYGRMNLMAWKNLQDMQVNLETRPTNRLSLKAEVHKFWLAANRDAWYLNKKFYRDKTGQAGKRLGEEFDLVGRYMTPFNGLEVQFGYGHFWAGRFVRKMADDVGANWCFFQLHYRFSLSL